MSLADALTFPPSSGNRQTQGYNYGTTYNNNANVDPTLVDMSGESSYQQGNPGGDHDYNESAPQEEQEQSQEEEQEEQEEQEEEQEEQDGEQDEEQVQEQEEHEEEQEEEHEEAEGDDEDNENDLFGDEAQDAEPRTALTSEAPTTAGTTPTPGPGTDDGLTSPERQRRKALEYEEDDQEEPQDEVVQLRDATVQIPNIPAPRSSDDNYWVIRLPNFIKFDSKPFHPDTYIGPEQDDDATGDGTHAEAALKERSMSIKLEVENTVRWRWVKDEDGVDRKRSNSRVIRWSDGSMSLQLGKELFDVNQNIDTTGATSRQMGSSSQRAPLSQSQAQAQTPLAPRGQGLTYLVAQHKRAEVLQSERLITGYLTLRPTGMQSETHRKLVRAVGQKHSKVARLRLAPNELVQRDPDRELAELAKNAKKGGKTGRVKKEDGDLGLGRRRSGGGSSGRRRDQMWSDDEDGIELGRSVGGSDSDDLGLSPKKGDGKKRERGEYQMDDFVVSDEDDEDEFGSSGKKKAKVEKPSEEKDALEEAEDRLEEEVRKRRQAKGGDEDHEGQDSSEEEDRMDVESEEEEEEDVAIRKHKPAGVTKRKRVAIEEEGDED